LPVVWNNIVFVPIARRLLGPTLGLVPLSLGCMLVPDLLLFRLMVVRVSILFTTESK